MYQNITIYIFFSKVYTQELQWNKWNKWNKDKTKQKLQLMRSLPRCPRDPITVRSSMNGGPNCIRKPLASKYQQSIGFLGQKNINKKPNENMFKNSWKSPNYQCEILRVVHFQLRFQLRWTAVHRGSRRGTARVSSSSFSVESQWLNSWVLCR